MSKISALIEKIEQQRLGDQGTRVLIVEGPDDVHAVTSFLNNREDFARWRGQWLLAPAGNKKLVLEVLAQKPDWIGIIDPDEWSEAKLNEVKQQRSNLWVLPRFCIENYLIVPAELYQALPASKKARINGTDQNSSDGIAHLTNAITTELDRWVAHGVLWHVINPLWAGLRVLGFKEALLDPAIAQNEQTIRDTLQQWHDHLEPTALFNQFQVTLAEVQSLTVEQKLLKWVHGKVFYQQVVSQVLSDLLGQSPANDWQKLLFKACKAPADFDPLWQKMGLI